jgi:hypothetical protein
VDSNIIVNRWQGYFSQLLDIHNVSDGRQIEIQTAETPVPDPSHLVVEFATANLKKYRQ